MKQVTINTIFINSKGLVCKLFFMMIGFMCEALLVDW